MVAVRVAPQQGAGTGLQRVQLTVVAEINHPVRHGRRRLDDAGEAAPQLSAGAGLQRVEIVVGADINHTVHYGGRGGNHAADLVPPLQLEVPNVVDVEHCLIRVPAHHVDPVELAPVVDALARRLLTPCHGRQGRAQHQNQDADSFHGRPPEDEFA